MSVAFDERGLPVEIGRIDKELGKLWEESGDTKTRASLVNLAIYTEDQGGVAPYNTMISDIASQHACRALLILANPAAESRAQAWITAHCHLADKGQRQVCSEQITFQLDGDTIAALPNIVFSHLDSDLPLYFWWRGDFRAPINKELWTWIDRLIYDSSEWTDLPTQLALLHEVADSVTERTVLRDLNWTRLFGARVALAQLFDHSCALARLKTIKKVTVGSQHRSTSLILLGWLAAQLGWKLQTLLDQKFFATADGRHVDFELTETPGADIGHCLIEAEDATFELHREPGAEYYNAHIKGTAITESSLTMSAGKSKLEDILLVELSRGGRNQLYQKALRIIEPLL